jgi:transcriptional regulator with XRE-family HTH domain
MKRTGLSWTLTIMTPGQIDALVAENVRATRARRRLRQEDLADALGWSRATITTLENGSRRVTLADAVFLCRALEVDLRELLRGAPADVLNDLGVN